MSQQLLEEVHPGGHNHKTDVTIRIVHRAINNANDRQKPSRRVRRERDHRLARLPVWTPTSECRPRVNGLEDTDNMPIRNSFGVLSDWSSEKGSNAIAGSWRHCTWRQGIQEQSCSGTIVLENKCTEKHCKHNNNKKRTVSLAPNRTS